MTRRTFLPLKDDQRASGFPSISGDGQSEKQRTKVVEDANPVVNQGKFREILASERREGKAAGRVGHIRRLGMSIFA